MIFGLCRATKGPLLVFDAEEINTIRDMLLRSDWRCEVTDLMQGFLETPEVIEYLDRERREAALEFATNVNSFYTELGASP